MREAPWSAAAKLPPSNPLRKGGASATALQGAVGTSIFNAGFSLQPGPFMVAYLCDGHGGKSAAVAVERSSKRIRPRTEGRVGSKKIVFLYVRSHQLIENKGRALKNEPKTNLKQT
jgi:hypothetical protein